jgi:peptide deformylase
MKLPVYAYGQAVLKKVAVDISSDYPNMDKLIEDMWETMYHAGGVGLAAPQVGLSIRLFVVDTLQMKDEKIKGEGIKQVFINPEIIEETEELCSYEEGCLSIPDLAGDVDRPIGITIRYLDEQFQPHTIKFEGINARVIQHEYDHIEGVLFIEHLKPLKRRLLKSKLEQIRKGKVKADYSMRFAEK